MGEYTYMKRGIMEFGSMSSINRRSFIRTMGTGGAALVAGIVSGSSKGFTASHLDTSSSVALTTGTDCRQMVYDAMKPFERKIMDGIGNRQVIIKVNMGQVEGPLNATHPDSVKGVLDFLAPRYKKQVIVAESTAGSMRSTLEGFHNFGYEPMLKEYNVRFVDLNDTPFSTQWIKGPDGCPLGVNIIDAFLDKNNYMISVTRLKSHNCVVATLSLKNMAMASPVNHFKQKKAQGRNEKPLMHSGGHKGLSYNMFRIAQLGVQPDFAVLDGVVGMEGNGPVNGTPIEHGVALAGDDWLAVDRIGVELMDVDYDTVKYLQWCGNAGMGQDIRDKIKIIGPDPSRYIKKYKLHDNIEQQLAWFAEDGASQ